MVAWPSPELHYSFSFGAIQVKHFLKKSHMPKPHLPQPLRPCIGWVWGHYGDMNSKDWGGLEY